jgi:dTDP-4-dehydrorhamnose 3,5-epimerase-like enzyme
LPEKIRIIELNDRGDARGFGIALPREAHNFVGQIADLLVASISPQAVRGNHYHVTKSQANVILPGSPWSLHWDEGESTAAQHRNFDGATAVGVLVSPGASHAVRNDGDRQLWLVLCSSEAYDPAKIVARKVI